MEPTMIRRCALSAALSLSAAFASFPLHAQSAGATGTMVNGRVVVQVFVTLSDDQTMYHPVAGLPLGFTRSARDTAMAVTDRSGSAIILLPPGQYRVVSLMPTQWKGMRYSWNSAISVQEDMKAIDLRRNDAMVSRAITTVTSLSDGEAPRFAEKAPAPSPARQAPEKAAAPAPMPVAAPTPVPAPTPKELSVAPAPAMPEAAAPAPMPDRKDTAMKADARKPVPARPVTGRSRTTGFFLGLGAEGNSLQVNEAGAPRETGAGGAFVLGYGFSPRWSLYLDGSDAQMNATGGGTYTLMHGDLGMRMHFRSGHALVPFMQFGATGRTVSVTANGATATARGEGGTVGAGFNAYFTRSAALSTVASWSFGNFNNFQVGNLVLSGASVNAQTMRVHVGFVWFP